MTCDCGGRVWARGRCLPCYQTAWRAGDFDCRPYRPLADVLEDWDFLRAQGYTVRQAAERLGMTYTALDRALCRGKAAGDPRARRAA